MNPLTEGNVSKSGHEWLEKVNREGMSKHTPGPWSVIPYSGIGSSREQIEGFDIGCELCRDGFHKIAKLETTKYSRNERANANLIAAAPDLFSALDRLTKWAEVMAEAQTCEHTGDHPIAIARAALIKAMTGESQ